MSQDKQVQELDRDWLTVDEAASYLRCSAWTIREYIKSGRLPASQLMARGRIRVPSSAIEKLLEKNRA